MRIPTVLLAAALLAGCSAPRRPISDASPLVRVLLAEGREFTIRPVDHYVITAGAREDMGGGSVSFALSNGMIWVNDLAVRTETVEIRPSRYFVFNGKKYRGTALAIAQGQTLLLVNAVDLESYVYGVLPNEILPEWRPEALKAQAVVSRTYALFELTLARKRGKPWDVTDDTRSQVYTGMDRETKMTTLAVDATAGEVVRHQGRIIQSFFHSASGGMTESSREAFGEHKPYLVPVLSPFSSVFKDNEWTVLVPLELLRKTFGLGSPVVSVQVLERTASKRIKTVELRDAAGKKKTVSASELRNAAGNTLMKSTRANIRITNQTLHISGMGYGHGVGLGQWDAQGMALKGYSYRDILGFFYPGTQVDRVW